MNYIYYSMYCCATRVNKRPYAYSRALTMFSLILSFYLCTAVSLSGYVHRANNQLGRAVLITIGLTFLVSRLYYRSNQRDEKVVEYYNEKWGQYKDFHFIFGCLWFALGLILVITIVGNAR